MNEHLETIKLLSVPEALSKSKSDGQTSDAGSRFTIHSISFRFVTFSSAKLCDRYTILKFPNKCKSTNPMPMVADKIPT